jgi:hypothetical protein
MKLTLVFALLIAGCGRIPDPPAFPVPESPLDVKPCLRMSDVDPRRILWVCVVGVDQLGDTIRKEMR